MYRSCSGRRVFSLSRRVPSALRAVSIVHNPVSIRNQRTAQTQNIKRADAVCAYFSCPGTGLRAKQGPHVRIFASSWGREGGGEWFKCCVGEAGGGMRRGENLEIIERSPLTFHFAPVFFLLQFVRKKHHLGISECLSRGKASAIRFESQLRAQRSPCAHTSARDEPTRTVSVDHAHAPPHHLPRRKVTFNGQPWCTVGAKANGSLGTEQAATPTLSFEHPMHQRVQTWKLSLCL